MSQNNAEVLDSICEELRQRQRVLLTSHSRPDGDSIGSQLALGYALQELGKTVRIVNCDRAPAPLQGFPGVHQIELADRVDDDVDLVVVLECGDLARTGVRGLEKYFIINIDHHPGNAMFGRLNWFDSSAAACGEMVFALISHLGIRLTPEIATHVYLAILTDTGSFHYSSISPRTFDICRQAVEAGIDPVAVARSVYDSNNMGRLKLFGAVLGAMQLDCGGRVAIAYLDHEMARTAGGTYDDTEGLINLPLTVKEIEAVVFFKQLGENEYRVSLRSKDDVNVGAIAMEFGGGGHKNASGCTIKGRFEEVRRLLTDRLGQTIDRGPVAQRSSNANVESA